MATLTAYDTTFIHLISPGLSFFFTLGNLGVSKETPVTYPKVPSAPINNCFKSYPVLSLRRVDKLSKIVPSGKTFMNLLIFLYFIIKRRLTTSSPSTLP